MIEYLQGWDYQIIIKMTVSSFKNNIKRLLKIKKNVYNLKNNVSKYKNIKAQYTCTSNMAPRNCSTIVLFPAVLYERYQHDQDGFREHEIHCQT